MCLKPPIQQWEARHTPATLDEYINQLDPWEKLLLKEYTVHDTRLLSPDTTWQYFILATDGSMPTNHRGGYGWVLADPTGNVLAQGSGPTYGTPLSPLRTEAFGLLASC